MRFSWRSDSALALIRKAGPRDAGPRAMRQSLMVQGIPGTMALRDPQARSRCAAGCSTRRTFMPLAPTQRGLVGREFGARGEVAGDRVTEPSTISGSPYQAGTREGLGSGRRPLRRRATRSRSGRRAVAVIRPEGALAPRSEGGSERRIGPPIRSCDGRGTTLVPTATSNASRPSTAVDDGDAGTLQDASTASARRLGAGSSLVQIQSPRLPEEPLSSARASTAEPGAQIRR